MVEDGEELDGGLVIVVVIADELDIVEVAVSEIETDVVVVVFFSVNEFIVFVV